MNYQPFPFRHVSGDLFLLDINKKYVVLQWSYDNTQILIEGIIKRSELERFKKTTTFSFYNKEVFETDMQKHKDIHNFSNSFEDKLNES